MAIRSSYNSQEMIHDETVEGKVFNVNRTIHEYYCNMLRMTSFITFGDVPQFDSPVSTSRGHDMVHRAPSHCAHFTLMCVLDNHPEI